MVRHQRRDRRGRDRARHARLAAAALAGLTAATGAGAQQPARPDSARRDSSARALPPVVTTVLRAALDPLRAPFAVAATTRAEVRQARPGLSLDEALRAVPGVQADNRFNAALGEKITIRGFGARTQFGVRGVRVLVDGVPATMPDGQTTLNHVELGALERAEVVRGPASALYGNAAGGVLQLSSEPSPAAALGQRVRVVGGSDGLTRLQSTTGGTTADGRGDWLLSAARLDYDGFRAFSAQRSTRVLARAGWEGAPGALRATFAWVDYDADNPGALADTARTRDPSQAFANNVRQRTGEEGRHGQLGLSWQRVVGPGTLDASAYGLARRLDNPIPVRVVALARTAGGGRAAYTVGVGGPAASAQGPRVRLAVGGEWQRQRDDRQNFANAQGVAGARVLDQLERVTNAAAFAQATATLGARATLLAGLRHDRVRFAAEDRLVAASDPDDSGARTMSATSPSVGVNVAVGRGVHVYANAAYAFETPTTTELANRPTGAGGFNPELEPQRARSVEAGVTAARALGRSLAATAQLAVFRARIADALQPFEVPGAPGRQFFRNAGESEHDGVEAAATLAVGASLSVRAAYTGLDARFRRYAVGDSSYAGRRVPGVAPRRGELVVSWRGPRDALVAVEQRAQSWTATDDANRGRSPGWLLTSARAQAPALRVAGVTVAPFAGVTNVFDVRWDAAVNVNAAGARYYEPGTPRAFFLGADLSGALGRR
ncbi:TonB-dependent receptor [Roseisolibacter sp. H3M3-2]|uniref:TonB-dependent receptor family protein n=1 Tax=Roseisolibacter sp. H3M3-2 TaxID=3031323 RepID=UPI0023DA0482|nr:TonB-dependent receptor [Roseisolibacter sp. H3M3-2]MDF1502613.1 TonB-dependent receptor [Roseisolibacter sp. H3M3-2]